MPMIAQIPSISLFYQRVTEHDISHKHSDRANLTYEQQTDLHIYYILQKLTFCRQKILLKSTRVSMTKQAPHLLKLASVLNTADKL